MEYSSNTADVQGMFGLIARRYDLANQVLSFGTDRLWRKALVRMIPQRIEGRILDLCTGTADLIPLLSGASKKVVGADFCLPMLRVGQQKLVKRNCKAFLTQADGLRLPFGDDTFEVVTVAFGVRNFQDLDQGLLEIRRVLLPDGHLFVLEFGQPRGFLWGSLFRLYSNFFLPLVGGLLTRNFAAYRYLPKTSRYFPCGHSFEQVLQRHGFHPVRTRALSQGIAYVYHASPAQRVAG